MTPEPPSTRLPRVGLEIPRAEDLRTPNPLARLAAERWRLWRQGAGHDALERLGDAYQETLGAPGAADAPAPDAPAGGAGTRRPPR
jgi:hypothetical protein